MTAAVHYSGYSYGNECTSRGLIVLITRAHTTERVTDYPAAHKGQPQSIPVEIIQFANWFNAGVLCRRSHSHAQNIQRHCKRWQKVEEEKKVLFLLMMPEIQTDLPEG